MTNESIKSNLNIDAQTGALILIDMLYSQKLINKKTYDNIQIKYNLKNSNQIAKKVENNVCIMYNVD